LSNDTLAKHAMPPLKTDKEGRKKNQKVIFETMKVG